MKLSIVIPAYNEEQRIGKSLNLALDYIKENNLDCEIIIVDDGSTDQTVSICKNLDSEIKIIQQKQNMGKGAAVRTGMLAASGDIVLFTDADFSTPIYEIKKVLKSFENGNLVCIGNRALDYSMIKEHQPFYREFMGKSFNKLVQLLVIKGVSDTQCGFKAFSNKAAKQIFNQAKINGFGFDVEILFLTKKFGYHIDQISVEWYHDDRSKVDPIKDAFRMFRDLLKVKRLHKNLKV